MQLQRWCTGCLQATSQLTWFNNWSFRTFRGAAMLERCRARACVALWLATVKWYMGPQGQVNSVGSWSAWKKWPADCTRLVFAQDPHPRVAGKFKQDCIEASLDQRWSQIQSFLSPCSMAGELWWTSSFVVSCCTLLPARFKAAVPSREQVWRRCFQIMHSEEAQIHLLKM